MIANGLEIFLRQYSSWPEFYQGFSCGIIQFARQSLGICTTKILEEIFLIDILTDDFHIGSGFLQSQSHAAGLLNFCRCVSPSSPKHAMRLAITTSH